MNNSCMIIATVMFPYAFTLSLNSPSPLPLLTLTPSLTLTLTLVVTLTLVLATPVPERPISAYPGLKFCSVFVIYLPMYCLEVTFCVIITVSQSKGSTVFQLELYVLRQENLA